MAISIDATNAKITIKNNGPEPVPKAFLMQTPDSYIVNTHLTNGFSPGSNKAAITATDAFTATATVPLTVPAADAGTLKDWNFGFIQFQKIGSLAFYYAAPTSGGGEVSVYVNLAPALTSNIGRDHSKDPNPPWLRKDTTGDKVFNATTKLVTVTMGDHPMCVVGGQRTNSTTKSQNYLRKLSDGRTFYSLFSARDPQGNYQHLAWFKWSVSWEFEFQWAFDAARLTSTGGANTSFSMGNPILGAPDAKSAKEIQGFLKEPHLAVKLGSDEQDKALLNAMNGAPDRTDNATYFGSVPDNFWTE